MTLREQLAAAFQRSGLSLVELRARTGLDITTRSLSRKLRGKQTLRTGEYELMARALGLGLAPPVEKKARRRSVAA